MIILSGCAAGNVTVGLSSYWTDFSGLTTYRLKPMKNWHHANGIWHPLPLFTGPGRAVSQERASLCLSICLDIKLTLSI